MKGFAAPPMPAPGSMLTGKPLAAPQGTLPARLGRAQRVDRRTQIRMGKIAPQSGKEFEGLGHEEY